LKAAVSTVLTQSTAQAAVAFAAGKAASAGASTVAAALAEGAIRAMIITKWATTIAVMILVGGLGIGLSLATYQALGGQQAGTPGKKTVLVGASQEGQRQARAKADDKPDKEKEAADRAVSVNNLKQMGLAMHNYHDNHNEFPAHAIYDKDGKKPLLSWRVAILPYIDEQALYDMFKLDEPWDSAHNKKLIDKMPSIYEPVGAGKKGKGLTYYQVFTGPDTPFDGAQKITLAGITDGTSQTLLAVEAKDAVTWTKPADLTLPKDKDKLPPVGGLFKSGMNALFFDGSVRFMPRDVSAESFRKIVTPAGGEIIDD
jgi:prepilin-type processing-associated H-X9-DG protein